MRTLYKSKILHNFLQPYNHLYYYTLLKNIHLKIE